MYNQRNQLLKDNKMLLFNQENSINNPFQNPNNVQNQNLNINNANLQKEIEKANLLNLLNNLSLESSYPNINNINNIPNNNLTLAKSIYGLGMPQNFDININQLRNNNINNTDINNNLLLKQALLVRRG